MITWMQRHKKWLVITIWISTIAFVGAGFVGWGSYDYGKKGGVVAVVGDREISQDELNNEYSALYNQYARIFGNSFNEEMAKKLNLVDAAYKQVVQKNLILSYADSLGLDVTNEDIAKELVKFEAFLKDGKFDKDTYVRVLNQNRTTPAKFEESLKRDILLTKVQKFFEVDLNKVELENLNKLLFVQNDIEYKVLKLDEITLNLKDEDYKSYWEKNKNSFMSEVKYELQVSKMPLEDSKASEGEIKSFYDKFKNDYKKADGKIKSFEEARIDIITDLNKKFTKKAALKQYLKLKKGEAKFNNTQITEVSKLTFKAENIKKITDAKNGAIIKPFYENGNYITLKVVKKIASKPLSFEAAKSQVISTYTNIAKKEALVKKAKNEVKTFKGLSVKNISRESIDKIKGLELQESATFLKEMFSQPTKDGYIDLGEKVVLFKVKDSKLASYDKSKDEMVKSTLQQALDQELMSNLIKRLESIYEVQSSIEIKE